MKFISITRSTIARSVLLAGVLATVAGCDNFLDVNNNPNGPSAATVSPNLYLAPMLNWLVADPQWDVSGGIPNYVQNWKNA